MVLTSVLVGLGEGDRVTLGDSIGGKKRSLMGVSAPWQPHNPIMISMIIRTREVLPVL
jgi:hypothetical protein